MFMVDSDLLLFNVAQKLLCCLGYGWKHRPPGETTPSKESSGKRSRDKKFVQIVEQNKFVAS
jgi:hypothetical protein